MASLRTTDRLWWPGWSGVSQTGRVAKEAGVQPQLDIPREWTYDGLVAYVESLPHDVNPHVYEIVDGALVVTPSPDLDHEAASARLRFRLQAALGNDYLVAGPIDIDLNPSYRTPDLAVLRSSLVGQQTRPIPPCDVLLVVEVVSPSSVTTDRITKPAQYAAAGIPAYWRVETDPDISLTAYELPAGGAVYAEIGSWTRGQTAHLTKPVPVDVPIGQLLPG
jgi:Uma2 family endonuclease